MTLHPHPTSFNAHPPSLIDWPPSHKKSTHPSLSHCGPRPHPQHDLSHLLPVPRSITLICTSFLAPLGAATLWNRAGSVQSLSGGPEGLGHNIVRIHVARCCSSRLPGERQVLQGLRVWVVCEQPKWCHTTSTIQIGNFWWNGFDSFDTATATTTASAQRLPDTGPFLSGAQVIWSIGARADYVSQQDLEGKIQSQVAEPREAWLPRRSKALRARNALGVTVVCLRGGCACLFFLRKGLVFCMSKYICNQFIESSRHLTIIILRLVE